MAAVYRSGTFNEDYNPTVFENFKVEAEVDGNSVFLELWDTAGQEAYDRLRLLTYEKTVS